ncbi:hypothetical protein X551_04782 [Methylibium sp. T29]|nr:hypothetical protein X551_04782 [Methylibium sp. T29]EWS57196.1 hypothetical protein Y694_04732 [Methylibium sp. T29-B]
MLVDAPVMLMPSSRASLATTHSPPFTTAVLRPGSLSRGWKGSDATKVATLP